MKLRAGLVGAWARSAEVWASLSTALMVASLAVVYAATRIEVPPLGCTVPQPAAKQAAFDVAVAERKFNDKDFGSARRLFEAVLDREPTFVPALEGLAQVLVALDDKPRAVQCYIETHGLYQDKDQHSP